MPGDGVSQNDTLPTVGWLAALMLIDSASLCVLSNDNMSPAELGKSRALMASLLKTVAKSDIYLSAVSRLQSLSSSFPRNMPAPIAVFHDSHIDFP